MPPLPAHNRKSISQAGPKGNDFFAATRPVRSRPVAATADGGQRRAWAGRTPQCHGAWSRHRSRPHGRPAGTALLSPAAGPANRRPRMGTTPLPTGKTRAVSHASALRAERAALPAPGRPATPCPVLTGSCRHYRNTSPRNVLAAATRARIAGAQPPPAGRRRTKRKRDPLRSPSIVQICGDALTSWICAHRAVRRAGPCCGSRYGRCRTGA